MKRKHHSYLIFPVIFNEGITMGSQQPDSYYDRVYNVSFLYQNKYQHSPYWPMWALFGRIIASFTPPIEIIDLGCGPGQFAQFLSTSFSNIHYTGFDFSQSAIDIAKGRNLPDEYYFIKEDFFSININSILGKHQTIITAFEVLEHLDNDIALLNSIPPATVTLFSVPSFNDQAHVRHFKNSTEVFTRYKNLFDTLEVSPFLSWFTAYGVRSNYTVFDSSDTPDPVTDNEKNQPFCVRCSHSKPCGFVRRGPSCRKWWADHLPPATKTKGNNNASG